MHDIISHMIMIMTMILDKCFISSSVIMIIMIVMIITIINNYWMRFL